MALLTVEFKSGTMVVKGVDCKDGFWYVMLDDVLWALNFTHIVYLAIENNRHLVLAETCLLW